MPAGLLWVFGTAGLLIVLVGVYVAGGDELSCVRVSPESVGGGDRPTAGPPVAECRQQTRRWLGKSLEGDSTYGGITKVDTILVRPRGKGAEDSWYVGLFAGEREVARVFASRKQVQAAHGRLRAWFDGGLHGNVRVEWSSWPFGFGAMGFGLVWLTALTVALRSGRTLS